MQKISYHDRLECANRLMKTFVLRDPSLLPPSNEFLQDEITLRVAASILGMVSEMVMSRTTPPIIVDRASDSKLATVGKRVMDIAYDGDPYDEKIIDDFFPRVCNKWRRGNFRLFYSTNLSIYTYVLLAHMLAGIGEMAVMDTEELLSYWDNETSRYADRKGNW